MHFVSWITLTRIVFEDLCFVQEVYEKQKELLLMGERVVLVTLDFDLNVHHPYKPLVQAIEKYNKVAQKALAQAAWSFVNDGYAKITLILSKSVTPHYAYLLCLKRAVQTAYFALPAI